MLNLKSGKLSSPPFSSGDILSNVIRPNDYFSRNIFAANKLSNYVE